MDRRLLDTQLIFMSDNGSRALGEGGSNAPLRGTKAQTWEGGQRVPCIMRWPGRIAPGTTCEGIASSIDLFATLSELAGAPLPDTPLDSMSLVETMLEGDETGRDTFAYYKSGNLEAVTEEFRRAFGDKRLEREGCDSRNIGVCANPKPLTEYDESYPYMIAYYDLPDMPTMSG